MLDNDIIAKYSGFHDSVLGRFLLGARQLLSLAETLLLCSLTCSERHGRSQRDVDLHILNVLNTAASLPHQIQRGSWDPTALPEGGEELD